MMKLGFIILTTILIASCTSQLKNRNTKVLTGEPTNKNVTVVNKNAIDEGAVLYYGSGHGMNPNQAFISAKKAALAEMASSLATYVISNSTQTIYDSTGYGSIITTLKDEIYGMNIIVDHQVVKYEEYEQYGAYRCKVFVSFASEAARIIASEKSEKLLQEVLTALKTKENTTVGKIPEIWDSIETRKILNGYIEGIEFNERGISRKEISNTVFVKQIERLSPEYDFDCRDEVLFVEDMPIAYGYILVGRVPVPKRYSEYEPVLATPLGAEIFVRLLNKEYFPSKKINISLPDVEDYNSIYHDLGTRPYITGYVYKGEPNEPNHKFILKFQSSRINIKNTLMEYYSSVKEHGRFYIKILL